MILTGTNQYFETITLKNKTQQPWPLLVGQKSTGKGHEGTYWDVVMFHILIGFRLYRCIHLSKLHKCTLKTYAFIYGTFTSRERNVKNTELISDMNAEVFMRKCTNVCNLLSSMNTSKIKIY